MGVSRVTSITRIIFCISSPGKRDEDDPPLSSTPDVQSTQRTSLAASNNGKKKSPQLAEDIIFKYNSISIKLSPSQRNYIQDFRIRTEIINRCVLSGYQDELEQQPIIADIQKFSAGSSPSREVQEIMSLSDEFYKDNQDEPLAADDQTDAEVEQNGGN